MRKARKYVICGLLLVFKTLVWLVNLCIIYTKTYMQNSAKR